MTLDLSTETNGNTALDVTIAPRVLRVADPALNGGRLEVAFIDTGVADWQTLVDGVQAGVEIVLLDAGQSGLAQMADWAQTHSGYAAIHILGHGSAGSLQLGALNLSAQNLGDHAADLATIGGALDANADILLYGCSVAAGSDGAALVDALARATQADIAASTDATGAAERGGDWDLEYQIGGIEAEALLLPTFDGTLSITGTSVAIEYTDPDTGLPALTAPAVVGDGIEFDYAPDSTYDFNPTNNTLTMFFRSSTNFEIPYVFVFSEGNLDHFTGVTLNSGASSGDSRLIGELTPTFSGKTLTFTPAVTTPEIYADSGTTIVFDFTSVDVSSGPAAPSTPDMTAGTDSGSSSTDNITNDTTPNFTITGTTNNSTTVTLFNDANDNGTVDAGESLGSAAGNGGSVTITASALADGTYNIKSIQTDATGTSSASAALAVTINATSTSFDSTDLNSYAASYEKTVSGQAITFAGYSSEDNNNGDSLALFSGNDYKVFPVNGSNNQTSVTISIGAGYTFDLSSFDYGTKEDDTISITVTYADNSTKTGSWVVPSNSLGTTPAQSIGTLSDFSVFSNSFPAAINDVKQVVISTANSGTSYSFGINDVDITDVKAAGPAAPSTPDMTAGTDSGSSSTDNITNDTTPDFTITGTTNNSTTVTLFNDADNDGIVDAGESLGTIAGNGGSVTITASTLADGTYNNIKSIQTDATGTSSASAALAITIDTTAPGAPSTTIDLQSGSDTGSSNSDDITKTTNPTVRVSLAGANAVAGDTLELLLGGASLGTPKTKVLDSTDVTTNGYVDFTITDGDLGSDGNKTLTAKVTDAAGNAGTAGGDLTITLDTTNPAVTINNSPAFAYTENASAAALDASATLTEAGSPGKSVLTLQITGNSEVADALSLPIATSSGINIDSTNLRSGTTNIGTVTAASVTGDTLWTITFLSSATQQNIQDTIAAIRYHNTSDNPGTLDRTVSFNLTDGAGNSASAGTRTVAVTAANDAPTNITLSTNSVSTFDGANATVGTLTPADVDHTAWTYTITAVKDPLNNTVTNTNGAVFDLGTLGSSSAASAATATLRAVSPSTLATGSYTVTVQVDDGGASGTYSKDLTVTVDNSLIVTTSDDTGVNTSFDTDFATDKTDGGGLSLREALHYATTGTTIKFSGISGGTITLGSDVNVADNVTFDVDSLGAPGSLTIAGTGKLILAGSLIVNNGTDDTLTINAALADNGTATSALTKTGAGTLVLGGTNNTAGTGLNSITVSGGKLQVAGDTNLSTGGFNDAVSVTLENGATLAVTTGTGLHSIDNKIHLGTGGGTLEYANTGVNDNLRLIGAISGGDLTKTGAGHLSLDSPSNSYGATTVLAGTLGVTTDTNLGSGTITLDGGTLRGYEGDTIDNAVIVGSNGGTISIDPSVSYTFSGQFSGSGDLVKSGSGNMTLSYATGDGNTHSGAVNITAGKLIATGGKAIGDSSAVTLSGSGVFQVNDSETIGALAGSSTAVTDVVLGNGVTLTVNQSTDTTFSGVIGGTNGSLAKTGSGTLTMSGANTYTGTTTVSAGGLTTGGAAVIADGSAVTVASGATLTLGGNETIGSLAGAGNVALGSNTLTVGGDDTSNTFSGVIAGSGGSLIKAGNGMLTLSGNNTYTGTTTVNAGTLSIAGDANLGTGAVTLAAATTLEISDNTGVTPIDNAITLSGAATIDVATGKAATLSGAIGGANNLTKTGTGSLTLSGTNTYTGTTTVSAGTLAVTGTLNGSGAGAVTVSSGATLAGTGTVNSAVSVNSGATLSPGIVGSNNDAGKLTINGNLTVAGTLAADINGTTAGTGYDQVAVTGAVNVIGAKLTTTLGSSYTPALNDSYMLIDNDTFEGVEDPITGTFTVGTTNLAEGAQTGSLQASYKTTVDGTGNDFTLTMNITPPVVSSIVRAGAASATVAGSTSSINYTVTFDQAVTGVDASDFTLTATGNAGGSIANVSGSGSTYTVTVNTLSGDGSLRLDLNSSGTSIVNGSSMALSSGYTTGETYSLDRTAPNAPAALDMTAATDSGTSNTDNITSNTTPTITGTAEAGSTVTLYDNGITVLGSATVDGSGHWSITATTLTAGNHTLSAQASDAAENDSAVSGSLVVSIDTSAPSFTSATVNASTLTLTYSDAGNLDAANIPAASAFTVMNGTTAVTVNSVAVNAAAKTVTLTLASAVANGDVVTVAYTDPTGGDDANAIQDTAGNDAVTLVATAVTNTTPAPSSGGGSTTPTTTTSTTVDGVTVTDTSNTGATVVTDPSTGETTTVNTQTVTTTVPVVTDTRKEEDATTHLADIPLVKNEGGETVLQASLPVGVGLTSEAVTTSSTTSGSLTLREQLIAASQPRTDQTAFGGILGDGIDDYVPGVQDQAQVTVRTVTFQTAANQTTPPAEPIVINGATGTGESDSAHPNRQEALVIDARNLPSGTVLQLNNVEFAIVVGAVRVSGGNGRNFAVGDDAVQYMVLGADDDVLHGGGGNDTVGSQDGNDQIFGDDGDDTVFGGDGDDSIDGGTGIDLLQADPGHDRLTGGAGLDHFEGSLSGFDGDSFTDIDFVGGESILVTTNSFTDAALGYSYDGSQTTVSLDSDGDGVADSSFAIPGHYAKGLLTAQSQGSDTRLIWNGDADHIAVGVELGAPALPQTDGQSIDGDGNGDGITDAAQNAVSSASFLNTASVSQPGDATTTYVTLVADSAQGKADSANPAVTITALQQLDAPNNIPAHASLPLGLIDFSVTASAIGATETFSLYVDSSLAINGYWKQNAAGRWVNLASSQYGGQIVNEGNKTRLDFQITDGGAFDDDGLADGIITDPGAPAYMTAIGRVINGSRKINALQGDSDSDDLLLAYNGKDQLQGGSGDDWLVGDNGRDTYVYTTNTLGQGDLQAGGIDHLIDSNGSRIQLSDAVLAQLKLDGTALSDLSGKHNIGTIIDANNGIAYSDNTLYIDVNGDGHFNAADDFQIEIISRETSSLSFNSKTGVVTLKAHGVRSATPMTGSSDADTLIGNRQANSLTGDAGDDRLYGAGGRDSLRGGQGDDVLIGGNGRDSYHWNTSDLNANGVDEVNDGKGSRLSFDADWLATLEIGGQSLADITARKTLLGNAIDADNSIAYQGGSLRIDLNGDGAFVAADDFQIMLSGTVSKVTWLAAGEVLVLG